MTKNKVLSVILAGSILIGGAGIGWANQNIPENAIPISAPITENSLPNNTTLETKLTDIEEHWAYNEIMAILAKGIMKDTNGNFEPEKIVLSTDFAICLESIFDLSNIINASEQPITRIEVAKAIEKAFFDKKLSVIMTLMFPIYEDTLDLTPEESSALSFVFNTGIMKGRTKEQFAPHETISRAELAVVLNRTLSVLELAQPIEETTN